MLGLDGLTAFLASKTVVVNGQFVTIFTGFAAFLALLTVFAPIVESKYT